LEIKPQRAEFEITRLKIDRNLVSFSRITTSSSRFTFASFSSFIPMAKSYSERLSKGVDYGECGLPERRDSPRVLEWKLKTLCSLIKKSEHIVVHTGAGISTSCGIRFFHFYSFRL